MRRVAFVVLTLALVFSVLAMGCESHQRRYAPDIRYRKIMHNRVMDADVVGMAHDIDACFLCERPTHLSPWYNQ